MERLRPAELIRAAGIARRYYIDGVSKVDIAEEFGLSRFKVARMLADAQAAGLVRIEITVPDDIDADLSDRLRSRFGLKDAIVAADGPAASARERVGRLAATHLTEILHEGDVVGLACSRTLHEMARALTELPKLTVVQLSGVHTGGLGENSVELVRRLASLARGPAYPIYAPLIVDGPATVRSLRKQPQVADALKRYGALTKAVVAIGSWQPPDSLLSDSLPPTESAALRRHGVRADVCGRMLDGEGNPVPDFADRTIGITIDELREVSDVIAVAAGEHKTVAIRAALNSGVITTLVTDAAAAKVLIAAG
ncbi:DNA-binding transcriptional regulator LsrR, DeoR family [Actinokineospora alba]|uniref:DNA-binding transcriptional regulator LsrR, DeoR family n=1 Tax=Actinokineospora alba TaxID=504798 RepID=A0A1H0VRB6_9PSEU|nr:sugar-binding domain-containing protein [Actinokineospora alba]TDP70142.1 transcriptional regulator [Actinokineospora alba]SDI38090.1 DNA-binding transcriptional regulator LsrR, DeoR family [Actinokineospora alba]SDP81057.1 DNA-binding transcriptional regulator LsrR, DeoR family [Actinokineospora alba]